MSKWDQVFTQVLASLVAGTCDDLLDRFAKGQFEAHALCLASIASIIADKADIKMKHNGVMSKARGGSNE